MTPALTPAQKLKTANAMWHSAWRLKTAMVRQQHPDWTDEQVRVAVRRIFLLAR